MRPIIHYRRKEFQPPGGFDPADLISANLWSWLKSDAGVETDDIGTVATEGDNIKWWRDQSGNGRDWTQATATEQPVFDADGGNAYNGYPSVVFNTTGSPHDQMDGPDMSSLTEGELFIVVQRLVPDTQSAGHFLKCGSNTSNEHYLYAGVIYDGFGSTARKTVGNPTPNLDAVRVCNVWSATNDYSFTIDVTAHTYTTASNTVGFRSDPTLGYGKSDSLKGDIAEVLIYDGKLSTDDRAAIHAYLEEKYGLSF